MGKIKLDKSNGCGHAERQDSVPSPGFLEASDKTLEKKQNVSDN